MCLSLWIFESTRGCQTVHVPDPPAVWAEEAQILPRHCQPIASQSECCPSWWSMNMWGNDESQSKGWKYLLMVPGRIRSLITRSPAIYDSCNVHLTAYTDVSVYCVSIRACFPHLTMTFFLLFCWLKKRETTALWAKKLANNELVNLLSNYFTLTGNTLTWGYINYIS